MIDLINYRNRDFKFGQKRFFQKRSPKWNSKKFKNEVFFFYFDFKKHLIMPELIFEREVTRD